MSLPTIDCVQVEESQQNEARVNENIHFIK